MNEYRMTREDLYEHECMGKNNLKARQGHYIHAMSPEEAMEKMQSYYPDEKKFTCDFTKKLW